MKERRWRQGKTHGRKVLRLDTKKKEGRCERKERQNEGGKEKMGAKVNGRKEMRI